MNKVARLFVRAAERKSNALERAAKNACLSFDSPLCLSKPASDRDGVENVPEEELAADKDQGLGSGISSAVGAGGDQGDVAPLPSLAGSQGFLCTGRPPERQPRPKDTTGGAYSIRTRSASSTRQNSAGCALRKALFTNTSGTEAMRVLNDSTASL